MSEPTEGERCTGNDCPGCAHARRHYGAHGCLVPNCTDPHADTPARTKPTTASLLADLAATREADQGAREKRALGGAS